MAKTADKKSKVAPPRPSDAARQAVFLSQTGLRSQGSAKQRRRLAAIGATGRR